MKFHQLIRRPRLCPFFREDPPVLRQQDAPRHERRGHAGPADDSALWKDRSLFRA